MKILIADDHALFRDGLSLHLERLEPQAVIFQAGSFSQVMKIINDEQVDVKRGILHHEEGVDILPGNIELSGFTSSTLIP